MDNDRFSLLLVDDDPAVLSMLEMLFGGNPYDILRASDAETAILLTEGRHVDAALLDLQLPGMDGLSLMKALRSRFPQAQFCIMTGHGRIRDAVAAIRGGASDFLEKPLVPETLKTRMSRIHEIWRLQKENGRLREEQEFHFGYDRLVGNSSAMRSLKGFIKRIAPSDTSVLILGETGCGKELVARAIHKLSSRAEKPFIPVDCASISENLMESEIFGHVKGAFTGADTAQPGLVRAADGGTIFFDEIGELSLQAQAKMLRLLQEHEVRPVGSAKSLPVDVRVVAATNRDLAKEVANKTSREDLFYRLKVLVATVPPLRERWEDIAVLATHFIETLKTDTSVPREISDEALKRMETYEWPGNVRELENAIRRAMVLCTETRVELADLPPEISADPITAVPLAGSLAAYEMEAIRNALERAKGKRKLAAHILGIGEATLYRKLNEYALRSEAKAS